MLEIYYNANYLRKLYSNVIAPTIMSGIKISLGSMVHIKKKMET